MDALLVDMLSQPNEVVRFVVDNNPEQVAANLSSRELLSGVPQEATSATLMNDLAQITDPEILIEVLAVPYVNNRTNYTGGRESELDAESGTRAAGVGLAIFNGVMTLGTSVATFFSSQNQIQIEAEKTEQTQILTDAQLETQQNQLDLAALQNERSKTFGVSNTLLLALLGAIVVVVSIAMLKK